LNGNENKELDYLSNTLFPPFLKYETKIPRQADISKSDGNRKEIYLIMINRYPMKISKLALLGIIAFIIIGCVITAGCTSNEISVQPSISDNSDISPQDGTVTVKKIAHRGLSSEAPENTLASFKLACEDETVWGVECDIFKTADNIFVISHDISMERMCGVDKKVNEMTLSEIQSYKVISGNGISEYPNEVFPSLEQYLQLLQQYPHVHAVIELKKLIFTDEDIENLLELCTTYLPPERICIIAEKRNNLLKMQKVNPHLNLQWVGDDYSFSNPSIQWCLDNKIGININYELATLELAELLHKHGLELNVWTINDEDLAKHMVHDIGVDYITSNYIYPDSLFAA